MRLRARVDANQAEVVKALRKVGASVQVLSMVGHGCPDLLVGYRGKNYLLELKDGDKAPSARKETPDEHEWIGTWRGTVSVVDNTDGALEAIGAWIHAGQQGYGCPGCITSWSLDNPPFDAPDLGKQDDPWFEEFWSKYPRKVDKLKARRAFRRIATSMVRRNLIMAGLEKHLPSLRARELKFVPHAATWLNHKRYEEEPERVSADHSSLVEL